MGRPQGRLIDSWTARRPPFRPSPRRTGNSPAVRPTGTESSSSTTPPRSTTARRARPTVWDRSVAGPDAAFCFTRRWRFQASDDWVVGLAGQVLFHRRPVPKGETLAQKQRRDRESAVWGRLIEQVGPPPPTAQWMQLMDRGADDFEVFCRARRVGADWIGRVKSRNPPGPRRVGGRDAPGRRRGRGESGGRRALWSCGPGPVSRRGGRGWRCPSPR